MSPVLIVKRNLNGLYVFGKLTHLFIDSIFPKEKKNILECNHCKRDKPKEPSQPIKSKFELEKKNIKASHLAFLWKAVIIACIGFIIYSFLKVRERITHS
jgi:hypothetical protein